MQRKNYKQISAYYQRQMVAQSYDKRRFHGIGGEYVNRSEINAVLTAVKINLPTNSPRILDLGAGRGRLSIPLKSAGYRVSCLDASHSMLQFLNKDFKRSNVYIQSVFDPIITKDKYAGITSLRFFDHFNSKDQRKIIANTSKHLDRNGLYFLVVLNSSSLEYLASFLYPYGRYNYYYSHLDYLKMASSLNLNVKSTASAFFLPRGLFLHTNKLPFLQRILISLDQWLTKLLPQFGAMRIYILSK